METLKNFFNPKIIAIVGASPHKDKVGAILMEKALQSKCRVVPINPNHSYVLGKKCYKNILEVPWKIDLAVIAIPAQFVISVLEECGKKKVKSIIIISAGFAEARNFEAEKELLSIAKKYKMRILGPNCFGIFNPKNNLDLTFSATTPESGDIAFISQSGALWSYISDFSIGRFGFSGFASLGNMADLEFNDFIKYFSADKKTKAIVLYIEKLKNGKKFIETCKKSKKKIFVVKSGKSEKGAEAAVSHTASLATDYEVYKGVFKQAGIELCESLLEAFEKASRKKLIEEIKVKKIKIGKKSFIITNAGGAGALLVDYLSENGFEIVDFKELNNPLDLLGPATSLDYKNALEKLKDEKIDSIFVILTPQSMSEIEETAKVIVNFKKQLEKKKRIIALFLGRKNMEKANKIFIENNVLYFNTLEEVKQNLYSI